MRARSKLPAAGVKDVGGRSAHIQAGLYDHGDIAQNNSLKNTFQMHFQARHQEYHNGVLQTGSQIPNPLMNPET